MEIGRRTDRQTENRQRGRERDNRERERGGGGDVINIIKSIIITRIIKSAHF